jgi:hypothetical protein
MTDTAEKPDPPHWLDPPQWWKRAKPLRWLIAAIAVIWIVHALDLLRFVMPSRDSMPAFLKGDPHPDTALYTRMAVGVPMMEAFRSYEDLATVTKALTAAGYDGWSTQSRRAEESPRYPPYALDTVQLSGYKHLDNKGALTLRFFNNRLFQAEFIPEDAEAYARRVRKLGLPRDANARAEKTEGNLRIASTLELAISPVGRQLRSEPFVLWQDLRLIRERDDWDQKFGAIPKAIVGDDG